MKLYKLLLIRCLIIIALFFIASCRVENQQNEPIEKFKLNSLFQFISSENYLYDYFLRNSGIDSLTIKNTTILLDSNGIKANGPMYHNYTFQIGDTIVVEHGECSSIQQMYILDRNNGIINIYNGSYFIYPNMNIDSMFIFKNEYLGDYLYHNQIYFEKKASSQLVIREFDNKLSALNKSSFYEVYFESEFCNDSLISFRIDKNNKMDNIKYSIKYQLIKDNQMIKKGPNYTIMVDKLNKTTSFYSEIFDTLFLNKLY